MLAINFLKGICYVFQIFFGQKRKNFHLQEGIFFQSDNYNIVMFLIYLNFPFQI